MEPDNGNDKNYNNNNNFKLKGLNGLVHKLRKGVKGIGNNAKETLKDNIRRMFKYIIVVVLTILKILLPVILFLACCWYVVNTLVHDKAESTISSYISNSNTISSEAKEAYETSGSLLYLKNNDIKEIAEEYLSSLKRTNNLLYTELSAKKRVGSNAISDIAYTEGFNITNAYEFILNAERMNFNRVTWKKYDRETEEVVNLELQTDEETNLKYPKNDEDTTKQLNYFTSLVMPYMQSYVVSSAMLSGISSKGEPLDQVDFAFQIIDKGYSVIDVLQFTLQTAKRDRTKKHYITQEVELTRYEKTVEHKLGNVTYVVTYCGCSDRALERKKEQAEKAYKTAFEANTELVKVTDTPASEIEKQFLYPIIKADTLKQFMRAEYEQIKYSDEDVENYENSDYDYVTNVEPFVTGSPPR